MHKGIVTGVLGFGLSAYGIMLDGLLTASVMKVIVAGVLAVLAIALASHKSDDFPGLPYPAVLRIWAEIMAMFTALAILGLLTSHSAGGWFGRVLSQVSDFSFWTGVAVLVLGFGLYVFDDFRKEIDIT